MLRHEEHCLEIEKKAKELIDLAFKMINIYPSNEHRELYKLKEGGEKILIICNTIRNYRDYLNSLKDMINIIIKLQQIATKYQFNEMEVKIDQIFLLAKNWLNGLINSQISNRFFQLIEIEKSINEFVNEIYSCPEVSETLVSVGEELLKKCQKVKTFLIPLTTDSFTSFQFNKIYASNMEEFLSHVYLVQEFTYEETKKRAIQDKIQSICNMIHRFNWSISQNTDISSKKGPIDKTNFEPSEKHSSKYCYLENRCIAEIEKKIKILGKTLAPEADSLYFERISKILSMCEEIKARSFDQSNEIAKIIFLDIKLMKRWTLKNCDKIQGFRAEDRKNKLNEIINMIEEIYQPAFKLMKFTSKELGVNNDFDKSIEKANQVLYRESKNKKD